MFPVSHVKVDIVECNRSKWEHVTDGLGAPELYFQSLDFRELNRKCGPWSLEIVQKKSLKCM